MSLRGGTTKQSPRVQHKQACSGANDEIAALRPFRHGFDLSFRTIVRNYLLNEVKNLLRAINPMQKISPRTSFEMTFLISSKHGGQAPFSTFRRSIFVLFLVIILK